MNDVKDAAGGDPQSTIINKCKRASKVGATRDRFP